MFDPQLEELPLERLGGVALLTEVCHSARVFRFQQPKSGSAAASQHTPHACGFYTSYKPLLQFHAHKPFAMIPTMMVTD